MTAAGLATSDCMLEVSAGWRDTAESDWARGILIVLLSSWQALLVPINAVNWHADLGIYLLLIGPGRRNPG